MSTLTEAIGCLDLEAGMRSMMEADMMVVQAPESAMSDYRRTWVAFNCHPFHEGGVQMLVSIFAFVDILIGSVVIFVFLFSDRNSSRLFFGFILGFGLNWLHD